MAWAIKISACLSYEDIWIYSSVPSSVMSLHGPFLSCNIKTSIWKKNSQNLGKCLLQTIIGFTMSLGCFFFSGWVWPFFSSENDFHIISPQNKTEDYFFHALFSLPCRICALLVLSVKFMEDKANGAMSHLLPRSHPFL